MSDDNSRKIIFLLLAFVIDAILLMAFISLSLAAYSGVIDIVTYIGFVLIWLVILLVTLFISQIPRIFVQYGQVFFKLHPDEMFKFLRRLVMGPSPYPPQKPVLHVQDGQVISEAPGILERVGGPGFLGVEHNNAVVTDKLGKLSRILGPGFHTLESFEKVWDVVDLRPQRRTINVRFITRDGIPAEVAAEVVFRIPFIDEYLRMKSSIASYEDVVGDDNETIPPQGSNFSTEAVLTVATGKIVNGPLARSKITDWTMSLPDVILDSAVRDVLECYDLDAFLYPKYWLSLIEFVNEDGKSEYKLQRPSPVANYNKEIETQVKNLAKANGIFVEYVELGTVMPGEDAITRDWLEFWQAKLQSVVYQHSIKVNVDPVQDGERARIGMLVDLITSTVQRIQGLADNELKIPPALAVMSFMEVLRSLSTDDPDIALLVNRNAGKLSRIIEVIQRPDPPVEETQYASTL